MANYKCKNLLRLNNKSFLVKEKFAGIPSTNEWQNSVYYFNKNLMYESTIKDKLIYVIINSYFNSFPKGKKIKKCWENLNRIFISIPDIKHSVDKINIDIYSYNKQKLYIIKILKRLSLIFLESQSTTKYFFPKKVVRYLLWKTRLIKINLFNLNKKVNKHKSSFDLKRYNLGFKSWKFINIFTKNTLSMKNLNKKIKIQYFINLIQNIKPYVNDKKLIAFNSLILKKKDTKAKLYKNFILNIEPVITNNNKLIIINTIRDLILKNKLRKINLYKHYISMLYLNVLKYNVGNMLGLINILNKIYNKKVNINIKNLKYLYMDNSIVVDAIVRKLNDRQKRVLRVMKTVLKHIKIPEIEFKNFWYKDSIVEEDNSLDYNIFNYRNNYTKEALNNINNKFLKNLRLQGNGRLTKRLTASRSMLKRKNKTALKMKHFPNLFTVKLLGHLNSNIQYLNINSYTRNGSFGFKSWLTTW